MVNKILILLNGAKSDDKGRGKERMQHTMAEQMKYEPSRNYEYPWSEKASKVLNLLKYYKVLEKPDNCARRKSSLRGLRTTSLGHIVTFIKCLDNKSIHFLRSCVKEASYVKYNTAASESLIFLSVML